MRIFRHAMFRLMFALWCAAGIAGAEPGKPAAEKTPSQSTGGDQPVKPANLEKALEKLKLPGVKINVKDMSVDVDASVCLQRGLLELIACTKDTKEHESIIMVAAKPSHIHTALLLIGAKPGNPAMRRVEDAEPTRFIELPPRGQAVDVFLVFENDKTKERPISEFIVKADHHDAAVDESDNSKREKFPTHSFTFAGSVIYGEGDGPKTYLADQSGSVISITTFGDELLCLPGVYSNANESLAWQANGETLPVVGTKCILRLRPQTKPATPPVAPAPADGK